MQLAQHQKIVLGLFCVGMALYGIGLGSIRQDLWGGIRPESFFLLGGAIFIYFHYQRFQKSDVYFLIIPIISFLIVLILGLLTYFDTTLQSSLKSILKSVNQHIISYFILFVIGYFFARYARVNIVYMFLGFFVLICGVNVAMMLFLGIHNGFFNAHNIPFFFKAVYTYNIWLIAPMAMGIAGVVIAKKLMQKIAFLGVVILALLGMFSNGERSFVVAFVVMVFVPFVVWKYPSKKKVVAISFLLCSVVGLYHLSKQLPERWNFAYMIDNFLVVWNTSVSQMGQYDRFCYANEYGYKVLECSKQSIEHSPHSIRWEHSSLARIAMSKSTLEAFLDNPFKSHTIGVFQIGEYLWHYYNAPQNASKAHNAMYASIDDPKHNGYNSPHNFIVSLLFCYGIIGFLAIVGFTGFMLIKLYHTMQKTNNQAKCYIALTGLLSIIGLCVQSIFDVIYPIILQTCFIMFGSVIGYCFNREVE